MEPQEREAAAGEAGHESWDAWVAELEEEKGRTICGEPTVQQPSRPCTRGEAWGVDGEDEGPCTSHLPEQESKRQQVKERYLQLVREGDYTLKGCAQLAGVDRSTLDKWGQTDEEFANERREAEVSRARRRMENLGDIMYREALAGKSKGSERVYLMKVYAASARRRGDDPPLDYDQPDHLEVSATIRTESAKDELQRLLTDARERLATPSGGREPEPSGADGAESAGAEGAS